MRGASALEELLSRHPDPELRVLVVWLPVITTDVTRPFASVRGRLRDPRVRQFWDPNRLLSTALLQAVRANADWLQPEDREGLTGEGAIVWDAVLLFERGASWLGTPPEPAFYGFPVVDSIDGLGRALLAGPWRSPAPPA